MISFKLDTGAEVTAISHDTYTKMSDTETLITPDRILYGPSRKRLVSSMLISQI